jgi:hypothetical protein
MLQESSRVIPGRERSARAAAADKAITKRDWIPGLRVKNAHPGMTGSSIRVCAKRRIPQ